MKSFPSTLNESMAQYGMHVKEKYNKSFDVQRLNVMNLNTSTPVIQELLKENNINIANYQQYSRQVDFNINTATEVKRENPNMLPYDILGLLKDYEFVYTNGASVLMGYSNDKDEIKSTAMAVKVAPSMFNPMYGVNALGLTSNVPLLNGMTTNDPYMSERSNLTVCTIRELCSLSNTPNSILGMARYKYADFMYCKDLGKVSNNYLITLRRFAHPVPDHIFELTNPCYIANSESLSFAQAGDIGRLVTWFGTDDNKLEDIIKFSYRSTWKELNPKIEEKDSTADDETTGFVGMLANTFDNGQYSEEVGKGTFGNHSLWTYLLGGAPFAKNIKQGIGKNNELLRNYDNNRVYEPKNTIQATYIYEGKIEFVHEFVLNFSYKLRAYDNINPKSAFLDLIGNILEVTARRGRFWGGNRKLIGPQTNMAMFNKVDKIIDNSFDALGGIWDSLKSGKGLSDSIKGAVDWVQKKSEDVKKPIEGVVKDLKADFTGTVEKIFDKFGGVDILKGYMKNALGRPTKIAWQSLLDGSDVGLWHVTIGNPKNPIMVMGNLIVSDSNIQQFGPLGLDDFPTELKVSITLKHARPRDLTDISRMYTKGLTSLYLPLANRGLDNYINEAAGNNNFGNGKTLNEVLQTAVPVDDKQVGSDQSNKKVESQSNLIKSSFNNENTWANKTEVNKDPLIKTDYARRNAKLNNYSVIMAALSANEVAN